MRGIDYTDGRSVSAYMMRGRNEVFKLYETMKKRIPGFEDSRRRTVAPVLGVRESRRIVGDFVLSVEDFVRNDCSDAIGLTAYGWDLHYLERTGFEDKMPPVCRIPYRIMVPRPIRNLICPGRAVSAERNNLGPLRVMAPCMAMGEAAGQAARQVVGKKIPFRDVDTAVLRNELVEEGAIVDWE
jgi:hypothetical protein